MDDERDGPDFRKLIAWQRAMDLTMAVYDATEGRDDESDRSGLSGDLRGAATTIPAKIAFGAGSGDPFLFLDGLQLADQARRELEVLLGIAKHRDVLRVGAAGDLERQIEDVGRPIKELRRNIRGEPEGAWFGEG